MIEGKPRCPHFVQESLIPCVGFGMCPWWNRVAWIDSSKTWMIVQGSVRFNEKLLARKNIEMSEINSSKDGQFLLDY